MKQLRPRKIGKRKAKKSLGSPLRKPAFPEPSVPRASQTEPEENHVLPLLSPTVSKLQHDNFCELVDMSSQRMQPSLNKVLELFRFLDFAGLSFKEWWRVMSTTRTTTQWETKLLALGMPAQQEEIADKDHVGAILFHHFDFHGRYHIQPLQTSPQEA